MATPHGKGTNVLVDGEDLTTYLSSYSTSRGHDVAQTTTFGSDDHTYIAGLESGSISLGGYFDGIGEVSDLHTLLGGLFGSANSPVITVCPAGYGTLGNSATMLEGIQTAYDIDSSVSAAVAITAAATANDGLRNGGEVVHILGARTAAFDGTSIDSGATAPTDYGGVAHLHVTEFTGTDVNIKIQDSANDLTWADLADFTGTNAVGGYRVAVPAAVGSVNRYLRAQISGGTFTTVTFALGFARNRR